MINAIEAQWLTDIAFTAAGCLGFCNAGPLMVVYPDGIWYRPTTADDIDEIIEFLGQPDRSTCRLLRSARTFPQ